MSGRWPNSHGLAWKTPEYGAWIAMRQRCKNPRSEGYYKYGAKGIKVCERWNSFKNFLADMGPKPSPIHQIERLNNSGDYEPSNCVWKTPAEQARNTSRTIKITISGVTKCLTDWCSHFSVSYFAVLRLRKQGYTPEEAIKKLNPKAL